MGRRAMLVFAAAVVLGTSCKGCRGCEDDDESEEQEERDMQRDHFWRAELVLVGQGNVKSVVPAFDCTADGVAQRGECGPRLVRFKELAPPMMEARPAAGWRLEHWDSRIREPDGGAHPRAGPMPDGRFYLNGFGYTDTGQLETVTAVFVPDGDAHDGEHP